MSSKILVIGDCHFNENNVLETEPMEREILLFAEKSQPQRIVLLGDILDKFEHPHIDPLRQAILFIVNLSKIAPTYVIIGNHDRRNNKDYLTDYHAFVGLKYTSQPITIIDKAYIEMWGTDKVVFVPYVPCGSFESALKTLPVSYEDAKYIFAHQEFKGASMGAHVSENGDLWPLDRPLVISGHIHEYCKLQENLLYVGTPIQHSFGESPNKYILLIDNGEFKLHGLNVIKKKVICINSNEIGSTILPEGYKLKIKIKGTSTELRAVATHIRLEEWKKQGHTIYLDEQKGNIKTNFETHSKHNFKDTLRSACSSNVKLVELFDEIFN